MENSFKINIPITVGYPFICIYDERELVDLQIEEVNDRIISKNKHSIVFSGVHGYNGLNVINLYLDFAIWQNSYLTYETHELIINSEELKIQGGWDELGQSEIFALIPTTKKVKIHYVIDNDYHFNIYIEELGK